MDRQDLQGNYFKLLEKSARPSSPANTSHDDRPAEMQIVQLLRNYADQIESGKSPQIFGYYEEKKGPFWELIIVLSHPWGG